MNFNQVKTPQQLMLFLNKNFEYGVIDNNGNKHTNSNSNEFQNICNTQWRLRSVQQILKDGVGHCYDEVEIEREWFTNNGFQIKTFWISAYQQGINNSGFSHTYLLYKIKNCWYLFEHADFINRGIYKFNSVSEAVKWQSQNQIKFAISCKKPIKEYSVCIKDYSKPPVNINNNEYLQFIDSFEDYII